MCDIDQVIREIKNKTTIHLRIDSDGDIEVELYIGDDLVSQDFASGYDLIKKQNVVTE